MSNRNREGEQRRDPKLPDNHARCIPEWRMVEKRQSVVVTVTGDVLKLGEIPSKAAG